MWTCSLPLHADAELISSTDHSAVRDRDVEHLFALHLPAGLILQRGDDAPGRDIDDLPRGRVRHTAVHAEADPADAVPRLDARDLFRRHYGGVEHVDGAVGAVGEPKFSFVRRQRDAMTRTAMSFDGALLIALHLDVVPHFAGLQAP